MENRKLLKALLLLTLILICTYGCRKEDLASLPQVRTLPITDVNNGTAKSGGEILNTGGKEIIFSGIVWSKTNNSPTIADDTTKSISQKSFVATLKNVDPSSTYYVRAYATTEIGVGYGEVMTITTENGFPEARNLTPAGSVQIGETLTADYTYFDFENDQQGQTTYQWYMANDATGTGEIAISGATTNTFKVSSDFDKKFLRVSVIPKATSGSLIGRETKSVYVGPVGEATSITFIYNGSTVTYNILTSPITGRKWLDRNLGAANTPSGIDDYSNFGDLFQWGRQADGHQLIIRSGLFDSNVTLVNGNTFEKSSTDKPASALFIVSTNEPGDWLITHNDNLWQGVNGKNNPCPNGWRLPTKLEWLNEKITSLQVGFQTLKLTKTGARDGSIVILTNEYGSYHSSSIPIGIPGKSEQLWIDATSAGFYQLARSEGLACRCIKE